MSQYNIVADKTELKNEGLKDDLTIITIFADKDIVSEFMVMIITTIIIINNRENNHSFTTENVLNTKEIKLSYTYIIIGCLYINDCA